MFLELVIKDLYKFLDDKFRFEIKKLKPELAENNSFYENLKNIPDGIVIKQKAKIYYNSLK